MNKPKDGIAVALPGMVATMASASLPRMHSSPRRLAARSPEAASTPLVYARMQSVVQSMLHSEHGVPIKSHKRMLLSAVPSAFTGADVIGWIQKNLAVGTRTESIHLANMLHQHGFFFAAEGVTLPSPVRDDGTLYRFQTPHLWPSQNPSNTDFDYGVYLVKQVLRSKHRIRLLDYELTNLHKLKLRLAREWKRVTTKAEDDVKIFREQKRVARVIMGTQEEAYWRLCRPPPGEIGIGDSLFTQFYTERSDYMAQHPSLETLKEEVRFLGELQQHTRVHMSTTLEGLMTFCHKYADFDPMLATPEPSNPWVSGDDTTWTMDKSLMEHPTESQVCRWSLSFLDLLSDVTGRYKFELFCKSQYCHENVRFWQACRDIRSLPHSSIKGSVELIYDEFLQHGAASEVNISAHVQAEVERDLKSPHRYAFSAAQDQIFHLMQNDIYPRFLKSPEYAQLLKEAKELGTGKGLLAKFRAYSRFGPSYKKVQITAACPEDSFVSPCNPQRYARRHLSLGRKLSSSAGSSSLDDIFMALASPVEVADKRHSAYTEAFIEQLAAPNSEGVAMPTGEVRSRRLSAPDGPARRVSLGHVPHLDQVFEDERGAARDGGGMQGVPPLMTISYSCDDVAALQEEEEACQMRKSNSAGKVMHPSAFTRVDQSASPPNGNEDPTHLTLNGGLAYECTRSRSIPATLSDERRELLRVPNLSSLEGASSEKKKSLEYESVDLHSSSIKSSSYESIHSASSTV